VYSTAISEPRPGVAGATAKSEIMASMETTIAVTGAASGLGRSIAARMLARNQPVVLVDRDAWRLHEASRELGERFGLPVATVDADLSTRSGIESAARELSARDDLAGLVNNAGGWLPGVQFPENEADEWKAIGPLTPTNVDK
jgi:17beta-estradiol 17-dehydrogenase / very-long-chain 3-oxoacyl-CoA reductase